MVFRLPPPPRTDDPVMFRWLQDVWKFIGGDDSDPVLKSLFDANTVLKADTDNTPEALTVGEDTLVGRQSGGSIAALTPSEIRTLADAQQQDTELDELAALSFSDGDVLYYNAGLQRLAKGANGNVLKQAAGIPSWATSGGGGLVLEDTDTADGTAEHLQVTATSSLTSIKRMVANFKNMVPEIDGDSIFLSVILDDDSEFATFIVLQFWGLLDTTFQSGKSTSATYGYGNAGNSGNESISTKIELLNGNGTTGTQGQKVIEITRIQDDSVGQDIYRKRLLKINSTKSIKGFRWDTDNAGDMLTEGEAEIWIQT